MRLLSRYIIWIFIPIFLSSLFFFAAIFEIADLFQNLNRYISRDVPFSEIAFIQLLFAPKCISYSIPIAVIFAVSFSLGNLYSNNELIAVFSSGISLLRFVVPLLVIGAILSVGSFLFDEYLVIDSLKAKTERMYKATGFTGTGPSQNVTLMDHQARIVYQVAFYHDKDASLQEVIILKRDEALKTVRVLKADKGKWKEDHWVLESVDCYNTDGHGSGQDLQLVDYEFKKTLVDPDLTLNPQAFRRKAVKIDELHAQDAYSMVEDTRNSGLPYKAMLLDYHERYSYAVTPLIVAFLSASIGSRFRKNVLLLSLLFSLLVSVSYFVIQMVAGLLAGFSLVDPLVGAWLGTGLYGFLGLILFAKAKT